MKTTIILLSILNLFLLSSTSLIAQEPQQVQQEDRSYLDMFTLDEQAIILAFENQLDQFVILYNMCNKIEGLELPTDIKLSDIAYLFYDYKVTTPSSYTLENFFLYLWKVDKEGRYTALEKNYSNFEGALKNFENKTKIDYNFIKNLIIKKEEEIKQKKLQDKCYKTFREWLDNTDAVRLFQQELLQKYKEMTK